MGVYIGTSGWSYNHWKENFYPEKLPNRKWLNFYSHHFSCVEINNTFYRVPQESAVDNWRTQVQNEFLFSVKASRYITHIKRLYDCQESLDFFLGRIKHLKTNLGPILFQLPPSFKLNQERLEEFISLLPKNNRYVFEFREASWFNDATFELLNAHNIALCITDLNGSNSPEIITADFTYLRLHGPKKAYQGSYGPKGIKLWADHINKWEKGCEVFCFFDNDEKGFAIQDALALKKRLDI